MGEVQGRPPIDRTQAANQTGQIIGSEGPKRSSFQERVYLLILAIFAALGNLRPTRTRSIAGTREPPAGELPIGFNISEPSGFREITNRPMIANSPWASSVKLVPEYKNTLGKMHPALTSYPPVLVSETESIYGTNVHPVVANLLESLNLRKDLRETQGVFRISPSENDLKTFVKEIRDGDMHRLREETTSIHLLAGALKRTLREQFSGGIISGQLKENLLRGWDETQGKDPERILAFKAAIGSDGVDSSTRETLKSIFCFFNGLEHFNQTTQMTADNLGRMVGPNLVALSGDLSELESILKFNDVARFMIANYQDIFE